MTLVITTVAEDVAGPDDDDPPQNGFGPPHPQRFVDELAERWRREGAEVVGEVVYDPISVASGLRAHLAAEPAGLVAVTTRAHTGVDRLRMGAVAADIVRTSTAPALVVPMTGA
jgi:nucleotide-binding universal stress UspA family protein